MKSSLVFCGFGSQGDHSNVTNIGIGAAGVYDDGIRASAPGHYIVSLITNNLLDGNSGVSNNFCPFAKSY